MNPIDYVYRSFSPATNEEIEDLCHVLLAGGEEVEGRTMVQVHREDLGALVARAIRDHDTLVELTQRLQSIDHDGVIAYLLQKKNVETDKI